jgi:HCOMODA/2-hydroxy-3-carboxy-muconic semialdehyde decarboxylase
MTTMEKSVQQKVICVCRVLDGLGLVEGLGHVSARLPDGNMLITPARGLGLVRVDELLTFNLEGTLVAGREGTAPLERWMHLAVYRTRPDVHAICRTHSRMAAVLGVANAPVRTAHGFGGMLGRVVPVHFVNDLITNDAMGQAVAVSLADHVGVLLRGNGALVTGSTLPQACVRAIYLEEAAWLQVTATKVGGAIPFTPEELNARSRWHDVEMERAWEYYSTKYGS